MLKTVFRVRGTLASVLALLLWMDFGIAKPGRLGSDDQAGDTTRIRGQVAGLQPGTPIEVRFISNEKVRAQLGSRDADGFTLRVQGSGAPERRVRFVEVKSLKVVQSRHGRMGLWITLGVVAAVVVVALAIYTKYRNNE